MKIVKKNIMKSVVNSHPKISVIIPVYNAQKYLSKCLDSIVSQTLKEIEIICVNDGSIDESGAILKKYAQVDVRIKIIKQRNQGGGVSRNNAIQYASGEYLAFVDSDDFCELNMLETAYNKAKEYDADTVLFRFFIYDNELSIVKQLNNSEFIKNIPSKECFSADDCLENIFQIHSPAVWQGIYKRSFIQKNQIRFALTYRSHDTLFSLGVFALAKKIVSLSDNLIYYRVNRKNAINQKANEFWYDTFKVYHESCNYFKQKNIYEKFKVPFLKFWLFVLNGYVAKCTQEPIKSFALSRLIREFILPNRLDVSPWILENNYKYIRKLLKKNNLSNKFEKIFYKNRLSVIPIVMIIQENELPFAGVSIQSIIDNSDPELFYDIYLLHIGLPESLLYPFEKLSSEHIRVTGMNISDVIPDFLKNNSMDFSVLKFFIPDLLFGYDKIIYLDHNYIVESDISKIMHVNLEDCFVAAFSSNNKRNEFIQGQYVGTNCLVFNVPFWKKFSVTERILDYFLSNKQMKLSWDDFFNIIVRNRIYYLDSNDSLEVYSGCSLTRQEVENAFLIHYLQINDTIFKEKFLLNPWIKYAERSIYYESIIYNYTNIRKVIKC